MTQSLVFYIASRYARSSRYNHFALLVQRLSVLGIAVGVTILIVISSIFNGFRHEITQSLAQIKPHIIITHEDFWWRGWQQTATDIQQLPIVQNVTPRIRTYGVVVSQMNTPPVQLIGHFEQPWPRLITPEKNINTPKEPAIVPVRITRDLQRSLSVEIGDTFSVMTANPSGKFTQKEPIAVRVRVASVINQTFVTDQRSLHMSIYDLADALNLSPDTINELAVTADRLDHIHQLKSFVQKDLSDGYTINDISEQYQALLASLGMQRLMMVIVLSLVVIVAACNLVTSLVMIVMERKQEIALLRTIGVSKHHILSIFVLQSLMLALAAVCIGSLSGAVIGHYITDMVQFVEQQFNIKLVSDQVFMLNYLPSIVSLYDIIKIAIATFALAILASLYPAYMACSVQPAEVLRYE